MNTRTIALVITLTALTIVLNPAFLGPAIPAPFLPIVNYHIYEIPIVIACFLIGPKYGFMAAVLNAAIMEAVFPSSLFIRPLPNLLAVSSMLFGIFLAIKLVARGAKQEHALQTGRLLLFATAFGMLCRLAVMRSFNYVQMYYSVNAFGVRMPEPVMLTFLALLAVFDITLVLYTIPTGYLIARTVSKNLNVSSKIAKEADYHSPPQNQKKQTRTQNITLVTFSSKKGTYTAPRTTMPNYFTQNTRKIQTATHSTLKDFTALVKTQFTKPTR